MNGQHLIAGKWISGTSSFRSTPAHGPSHIFSVGNPELIDQAVQAAEDAFWEFSALPRSIRAELLNKIADEIDARGDALTEIATQESGLPEARIIGERGRTVGQLRMFASHIEQGEYLDCRTDEALPDRAPMARPEMQLMQRPIGPVAVFGASNFPLAFSVAGGDTASALAAGCPVVVKGHSAHPGTSEIVAEAICTALKQMNLHPGIFSLVQGGNARDVGTSLVQHPLIKAVGFTGSLAGGRALFDLCASRSEPIPFFGELGSVNPVFLLQQAASNRAAEVGIGWANSLTMGAGQFCTNPGVILMLDNDDASVFTQSAIDRLSTIGSQTMLTDGISDAYRRGTEQIRSFDNIGEIYGTSSSNREVTPNLFTTTGDTWLLNKDLNEEVFGPLGIIVRVRDFDQMMEIARNLDGQLTCTLQIDSGDHSDAQKLLPVLERKAGRILANGFPTGVEVCDTMVHGGPYPASTNFGATSVGTMAIRRFLRPVCYQNIPASLRHSALN